MEELSGVSSVVSAEVNLIHSSSVSCSRDVMGDGYVTRRFIFHITSFISSLKKDLHTLRDYSTCTLL